MAKTLYETLGVAKNASQDEIKKSYRKLAREFHPDKNAGDKDAEERFKEVQTAYDVLSDPEKRKQYDRFGSQNGRPVRRAAARMSISATSTSATSISATCSAASSAAVVRAARQARSAGNRSAATTSRLSFICRSRTRSRAPRRRFPSS